MKKLKFAILPLLASTVLLSSCSSTSCFNPCNWRPSWKKSCSQKGTYNYDYSSYDSNSYDSNGYDSNGYENGYSEDYGYGNAECCPQAPCEPAPKSCCAPVATPCCPPVANPCCPAKPAPKPCCLPETTGCNVTHPYPDTSVEDMPTQHFIQETPLDSRDTPYYDDMSRGKVGSDRRGTSQPTWQKEREAAPIQEPEEKPETPSIQKKDLDKIKSAHQRVLDRYKQYKTQDDPVTSEDTEYFEQIIKRVKSKQNKN